MTRRLAAGLAVLAISLGLSACGGADAGDDGSPAAAKVPAAGARALAERAFGPNPAAASGRIDGKIRLTITGVPRFREPVELTVGGPYRDRAGAAVPDYALEMGVRGNGITLTSLRGRSYVSLGTAGYEIPRAARRRLERAAARGRNGLTRTLEQFGIAPWRWEIDKRVGGSERIDGVRTVRVDTGVEVVRVLRDANTLGALLGALGLAQANGLPAHIPPAARRILRRSVKAAKGASWIGVRDGVMRRAAMSIDFAIAPAQRARLGGIASLEVAASVAITDVGRSAPIAAPQSLAPYSSFRLALDALAADAR